MIIPERPIPGAKIPQGWFADFYDYVMSQRLRGDGRTFFTKDTDQGRVGSTKPEGFTPGAGGGGSSTYTLFQVSKLTDTSIQILGYNTGAQRYSRNLITHGLTTFELADGASVTGITATGVIYLSITWSGTAYAVAPLWASSMPAQDTTHIYWYLADVTCNNSIISAIYQPPISQINIPARAG
ncbi:MAG: hypothetical protein A2X45_25705 [Lentisphaerae bacterium GWF2_50_93]|nr:MAG: hypothetical protein A2X45_25705 [Lentisphaerae bacterium GWF2_50_93]